MAQEPWVNLDPSVDTGTTLADKLNALIPTLYTQNSGAGRPSYATAGMIWIDTTEPNEHKLYLYDGIQDQLIASFDPAVSGSLKIKDVINVYKTYADLELAELEPGQLARTKGYSDETDGQSTLFQIYAAGTATGVTLANGNVAVPYVDGTAQMRRNYIINGDMSIWQRGTFFELTTAQYTADRWYSPSSRTTTRSTDVPPDQGFQFSLSNRRDNPNSGNANIHQAVEISGGGSASPFIKGKTYTLSGWIKGQAGRQFSVTAGYADAVDQIGDDSVLDSVLISDNEPDWKKFKITFTIDFDPESTNKCLDFIFYSELVLGVEIGFLLTGVQLEDGPIDTPFEFLQEQEKIALCQRYCRVATISRYQNLGICRGNGVDTVVTPSSPVTKMRTTPTATPVVTTVRLQRLRNSTELDGQSATVVAALSGNDMFYYGVKGLSSPWQISDEPYYVSIDNIPSSPLKCIMEAEL